MVKREKSKQKNLGIYSSLKSVIINTVSFFVMSSIVVGISNWSESQSLILKTSEYLGLIGGSLIAGIIMSFLVKNNPVENHEVIFIWLYLKLSEFS